MYPTLILVGLVLEVSCKGHYSRGRSINRPTIARAGFHYCHTLRHWDLIRLPLLLLPLLAYVELAPLPNRLIACIYIPAPHPLWMCGARLTSCTFNDPCTKATSEDGQRERGKQSRATLEGGGI